MKRKFSWIHAISIGLIGALSSCTIGDNGLGTDILPPGDNVIVYHDTIFEIEAYTVSGKPLVTSETFSAERLMLLGSVQDSVFGRSTAAVVTQFNTTSSYMPAANTEIDSLFLALYMPDFVGDDSQDINVSVYEFTERLTTDTSYYSDYDVEGLYNPIPLVQKTITPEEGKTYELLIENQEFINKFLDIQADTAIFYSDSIFKDYFNGFYITAEPVSPEGCMARVLINNTLTRLTMKYANDSTEIDSTAERDFFYAHFSINEYSSQKINLFEHDYSGTQLDGIVDDEFVTTPYSYVQGMSGVNTRFSFSNLAEWIAQNPIIVNSATMVFDVIPEEQSGILYDEIPDRLMMASILDEDSYEPIYDFNHHYYNDPSTGGYAFGGYKKGESQGLFSDTTYTYRFNMGLHFQAMLDGAKTDNDFILQLDDGLINPKITKLWSNLPTNERRIRLEIVYLKL